MGIVKLIATVAIKDDVKKQPLEIKILIFLISNGF